MDNNVEKNRSRKKEQGRRDREKGKATKNRERQARGGEGR